VKETVRCLWLAIGLVYILGCATLPDQPEVSAPYAVLEFPASMQLLILDDQTVDSRTSVKTLRVSPGRHILHFVHINAGVDGSVEHAGQHAAPFTLDVHEGLTYHFESKT
jgi:hypothetical protein